MDNFKYQRHKKRSLLCSSIVFYCIDWPWVIHSQLLGELWNRYTHAFWSQSLQTGHKGLLLLKLVVDDNGDENGQVIVFSLRNLRAGLCLQKPARRFRKPRTMTLSIFGLLYDYLQFQYFTHPCLDYCWWALTSDHGKGTRTCHAWSFQVVPSILVITIPNYWLLGFVVN